KKNKKPKKNKRKLSFFKYWVRIEEKIWTCRMCHEHGEPAKTWTSQGWVRNHWLKCKYNQQLDARVPRALPLSKKKAKQRANEKRANEKRNQKAKQNSKDK